MKSADKEARIIAAKRRNLEKLVMCASIAVYNRYLYHGQTLMDCTYPAMDIDARTLKWVKTQIARIEHHRDELMVDMNWKDTVRTKKHGDPDISNAFHRSSLEILQIWMSAVEEYAAGFDTRGKNAILAYLQHMAFYDLARLNGHTEMRWRWIVQTSCTLASRMIDAEDESILVALNQCYWRTRDAVFQEPEGGWPDLPMAETPLEHEIMGHTDGVAGELHRWSDSTPKDIMRLAS